MDDIYLKEKYKNYKYFEGYYYFKIEKVNKENYLGRAITLKSTYPEYDLHTKQVDDDYYLLLKRISRTRAEIKEQKNLWVLGKVPQND